MDNEQSYDQELVEIGYDSTTVIGKIVANPEMRYTGSGTPVCNFAVVVTKLYEKDGKSKAFTRRWNVTAWNKLAELCGGTFEQGDLVLIIGEAGATGYAKRDTGEILGSLGITASVIRKLSGSSTATPNPNSRTVQSERQQVPVNTSKHTSEEDIPF